VIALANKTQLNQMQQAKDCYRYSLASPKIELDQKYHLMPNRLK